MDGVSSRAGIAVTALRAKQPVEEEYVNYCKNKIGNQIVPAIDEKPVSRQQQRNYSYH